MKNIAIFSLVAIVTFIMILRAWSPEGIVIVPGYEHGVAICEYDDPTYNEDMVTQEGEYHMWVENGVLYTVNYGHLNDSEVEELKYWGEHECAQYMKK